MSGLAALLHRDGRPVERASVAQMLAAVPYRGPDGMWVQLWHHIGLGYAKLAMTPEEEAEVQPLVSPRTECAIIADVRLDNRAELRALLGEPTPNDISDAELILRAYEKWHLDAPARLLGDFAFVIWDARRRRLVAARDTYGQRPLFFRHDGRTFAAASEIHQLLQDPTVPLAPNEDRIREALVPANLLRNSADRGPTFYAGIWSLEPGTVLAVSAERMDAHRYWEFKPGREIRYRRDEEYVEHFRTLLFQAVRDRLRTARPVGAMLSGGLDSSSMVCTVQELLRAGHPLPGGFQSFSLVFPGEACDERPLIEDVQAKYGFAAHYIEPPSVNEWSLLEPDGFRHRPDIVIPGIDALFGAASRADVRSLLVGDIADNYLRGTPYVFDSLLKQGQLAELWRRLQVYHRESNESLPRIVGWYGLAALLPLGLQRRLLKTWTRRDFQLNRWRTLPVWIPESLEADLFERHLRVLLEREEGRQFQNEAQHLEHQMLYPPEEAPLPVGWPLTLVRPYADRRLHEYCLGIPPEQKFVPHPTAPGAYAGGKRLLRQAMVGLLPESIRTKTAINPFNVSITREIERNWSRVDATFGPRGRSFAADYGYIDPTAFWTRLTELRHGNYRRDFQLVRFVLGLEMWLHNVHSARLQAVTVSGNSEVPSPTTSVGGQSATCSALSATASASLHMQ